MKKIILFLFLFPAAKWALSQHVYYAAAKNGLSLREKPGTGAAVLEKIAYGEKLLTVADNDPSQAISTEGFNGYWWKVTYKNKTGYIVSSYVLPVAPPAAGIKNLKDYFTQVSSPAGKPLVVKRNSPELQEAGELSLTKQLYKNGMEWHETQGFEYGSQVYVLPDFSIEQGFLLLRLLGQYPGLVGEKDSFPAKNSSTKNDVGEKIIELQREKTDGKPGDIKKIRIISTQGAYTEFELFLLDTQLVVYWSSGV